MNYSLQNVLTDNVWSEYFPWLNYIHIARMNDSYLNELDSDVWLGTPSVFSGDTWSDSFSLQPDKSHGSRGF